MKRTSLVLTISILFFVTPCFAFDLTLTWNPNPETDLAGYKVYRSSVAGGPYTIEGNVVPSLTPNFVWPVPANTEAMQYFVVTAHDTAGNESVYSNEVSIFVDNKAPGMPQGLQVIIIVLPGISGR